MVYVAGGTNWIVAIPVSDLRLLILRATPLALRLLVRADIIGHARINM